MKKSSYWWRGRLVIYAMALLLGLTGTLYSVGGSAGASGSKISLTYASFGGSFEAGETSAFLGPFMKANPNVTILQDPNVNPATVAAMQLAHHVTWNIASTGNSDPYNNEKNLVKINCKIVACNELIPNSGFDGYRMPYYTWATAITYNTKDFHGANVPQNWADFFNVKKYPGMRTMFNYMTADTLEAALIASGVKPDKLYPLDMKRAFAELNKLKGHIIWYSTGQQCESYVASGEASMGNCWNGRAYAGAQNGDPVAVQWNQCFQLIGDLAIVKGSANVNESMKLLAFITSAQHNARLSHYIAYGPTNALALKKVPASVKPYLSTSHTAACINVNDSWLGSHPGVQTQLQQYMSGGG
jgi:putative spermidine/putrescine transport system substrate-binding protein